jgi:hypothetical protein
MFLPDPGFEFFSIPDPGSKRSRIQGQKDPGSRVKKIADPASRVFLTKKTVSRFSEKWSGMFISNPDFFSFPDPDLGSSGKKASDPQHCLLVNRLPDDCSFSRT